MTENNLHSLSIDLRLLARASIWTCPSTGRVLQGSVDRKIEALREVILDALWAKQDGLTITQQMVAAVTTARTLCLDNQQTLRQLRRAAA
jgi:hypothetical protein